MGETRKHPAPAPPRLSIITLGVPDLPRARGFYQRVGFERPHDLPDIVFLRTTGPVLALCEWDALAHDASVSPTGSGFRGVTLACNVDSEKSVDATCARWLDAGTETVRRPVKKVWGGYSGYVADPDGHLWEIAHNPSTRLMRIGSDGVLRLV